MANIVVGLYNDIEQATQAISQLKLGRFWDGRHQHPFKRDHGTRQRGLDDKTRSLFGDMKRHSLSGIGNVYASGPLAALHLSGDTRLADAFLQIGAQANDADAYLEALRRATRSSQWIRATVRKKP